MPRSLSSGMETSVAAERATLVHFVELSASTGTLRLCTAWQNIVWDGETWAGTGGLLEVGPVQEAASTDTPGIPLTMSGVDQTVIAILLGAHVRGRTVRIWMAHLDDHGKVIADPLGPFTGFLNDDWTIEEERGEDSGTVTIKTQALTLGEVGSQNRTLVCSVQAHATMLARMGQTLGDKFFQLVPGIAEAWASWGGQNKKAGGGGGSGGLDGRDTGQGS